MKAMAAAALGPRLSTAHRSAAQEERDSNDWGGGRDSSWAPPKRRSNTSKRVSRCSQGRKIGNATPTHPGPSEGTESPEGTVERDAATATDLTATCVDGASEGGSSGVCGSGGIMGSDAGRSREANSEARGEANGEAHEATSCPGGGCAD